MNAKELLKNGIAKLDLVISLDKQELLISYTELLKKWNKVFSLTAINNQNEMIKYHVLDALSAVNYFVDSETILDVGSGMGVPAVILAIIYPNKKIVAVDSNAKKASFLTQCKIELKLTNLQVMNKRVEDLDNDLKFDVITSRAFADLNLFIKLTKHLINQNGCYLAFKGEKGIDEAQLLINWQAEIIKLNVPYVNAERFLIKMEKYV